MKRLFFAVVVLLSAAIQALAAGFSGGGSTRNSFYVPVLVNPGTVITGADPVTDTTGHTEVACGLVSGERTGVIVFIGQSLSVNEVPTTRVPTYSKNHQLNIWDGKCYQTKESMLGINVSGGLVTDQRGTWMSRLADQMISNNKYDRFVIVPMAVGNTTVGQWADNTASPYLFNNINTVAKRMRDAGLPCTAIHWGQGESDTNAGTSQASYTASLNKVIAAFNRELPGCPILVAKETWNGSAFNSGIQAAQAAVVNSTTVFTGEDVDSIPTTTTYRYDNLHLNELGADTRASAAYTRLVAVLGL